MSLLDGLRTIERTVRRREPVRRILVDSRTGVNYEMVAPVVRAMRDDDRVEFAFTASEEPQRLNEIYQGAAPGTRLVGPRRAAIAGWDAYLTSDFMWATLRRAGARIQMFHGVAGKYGFDAPDRSMRDWHRLFFVNERRLRNFVAAGAIDADSRAAVLVGMPKVDCLVDGTFNREALLREFALDPSRPTVLYAPTWSAASSLNVMGVELLERLRELPINLLVKLHDRSRDPRPQYSGGVDWVARLRPLLRPPHGLLVDGANITPCLAAADVMISDHSSAAFEYLLLDRPLVRIELPELIAHANVHRDYVDLLAQSAANATDVAGTVANVERALAEPGALSATRRAVAADLFYRPGTASVRCAAALYDAIGLPAPAAMTAVLLQDPQCLQSA